MPDPQVLQVICSVLIVGMELFGVVQQGEVVAVVEGGKCLACQWLAGSAVPPCGTRVQLDSARLSNLGQTLDSNTGNRKQTLHIVQITVVG